MQRTAHGIRVGHLVRGPEGEWLKVLTVDDRSDRGYIRTTVHVPDVPDSPRVISYSTMEDVEYRNPHSDDAGVQRIALKDGKPSCPNEFPHVPHTNAVFTDWQQAESWDCDGGS